MPTCKEIEYGLKSMQLYLIIFKYFVCSYFREFLAFLHTKTLNFDWWKKWQSIVFKFICSRVTCSWAFVANRILRTFLWSRHRKPGLDAIISQIVSCSWFMFSMIVFMIKLYLIANPIGREMVSGGFRKINSKTLK